MWGWITCACVTLLNLLVVGVWKPYLAGYSTEKGKRLATSEDLELLRAEVRATTREAESIKAQIQGGLWQEQWLLNQNRDMYARVLEALSTAFAVGTHWHSLHRQFGSRDLPEHIRKEAAELRTQHHEADRLVSSALLVAGMFIDLKITATVENMLAKYNAVGSLVGADDLEEFCRTIQKAVYIVQDYARREIGPEATRGGTDAKREQPEPAT